MEQNIWNKKSELSKISTHVASSPVCFDISHYQVVRVQHILRLEQVPPSCVRRPFSAYLSLAVWQVGETCVAASVRGGSCDANQQQPGQE